MDMVLDLVHHYQDLLHIGSGPDGTKKKKCFDKKSRVPSSMGSGIQEITKSSHEQVTPSIRLESRQEDNQMEGEWVLGMLAFLVLMVVNIIAGSLFALLALVQECEAEAEGKSGTIVVNGEYSEL